MNEMRRVNPGYKERETGEQRDPGGRGEGILESYIELSFSTGAA